MKKKKKIKQPFILFYLSHVLFRKVTWSCTTNTMGTIILEDSKFPFLQFTKNGYAVQKCRLIRSAWSKRGVNLGSINKTAPGKGMKTSDIDLILCTRKHSHKFHIWNSVNLIDRNRGLDQILVYSRDGISKQPSAISSKELDSQK